MTKVKKEQVNLWLASSLRKRLDKAHETFQSDSQLNVPFCNFVSHLLILALEDMEKKSNG